MARNGVVGGEPVAILRTPSGRTRQVKNPFTGETEVYEISDVTKISLTDIAVLIRSLHEFRVEVSGMGRPMLPPLPLDFDDPYHVAVVCVVHREFRTTSNLHEESNGTIELPFFDSPCECNQDEGLFSNPHTLEIIRVPLAGCARFWIEFQLGNSVFPEFERNDLNLLAPSIIDQAVRVFGTKFVQGCFWG